MDLNQVTAPSTDLSRSVKFYELLGLRLIVDSKPDYVRFECPDGNSTFSLHRVEFMGSGEGVVIYFECEDLDTFVHSLSGMGIRFDEMPEDRRWLWREARLRDPDGNRLILYKAGKNRKYPKWRIDP